MSRRTLLVVGLTATGSLCNGSLDPIAPGGLIAEAQARVGRPATSVSYAGVARRSTVRAVTPGVGAPSYGARPGVGYGGVGGPASGVGSRPGTEPVRSRSDTAAGWA